MHTPWGNSQQTKTIAPGITRVHTAGHGGIRVDSERLVRIPEPYRSEGTPYSPPGWFEEDNDVVIVILAFPEHFTRLLSNGQTVYQSAVEEVNGYARNCADSYLGSIAETFGVLREEN